MLIQTNTYTIHTNTIIHTQYKKRPKYKPIQANVRIVYVLEGSIQTRNINTDQYKHARPVMHPGRRRSPSRPPGRPGQWRVGAT